MQPSQGVVFIRTTRCQRIPLSAKDAEEEEEESMTGLSINIANVKNFQIAFRIICTASRDRFIDQKENDVAFYTGSLTRRSDL